MATVTMGVFKDQQTANEALDELQAAGYGTENISVIMREVVNVGDDSTSPAEKVTTGTVTGAATGGLLGALAGLLVGIGAIAIPGIGGILVGGPVTAALGLTGAAATTVSGGVTGALAGGLVGALVNLGVPEETAKVYEERIREGAVLVAVSDKDSSSGGNEILARHGAEEVRTVQSTTGWTRV